MPENIKPKTGKSREYAAEPKVRKAKKE